MREDRFSEDNDRIIKGLSEKIKSSKSIAVVGIERVPAKQFQQIRKTLRGKAEIRVVKKTFLKRALEESNVTTLKSMEEFMDGPIATIFSNEDSFKLFRDIESSRTKAPAKGGETAQEDIIIEAKATNLKPGPVVGELQKAGIPAAIDQGKVIIRKDIVLVKKGEKISKEKANAMTKLEIFPLEIGLDFRAAHEDGIIFHRDALSHTVEEYVEQLTLAHSYAMALAVNIEYYTKDTAPIMISRAYVNAFSLSLSISYPTKENIRYLLAKAAQSAKSIESKVQGGN
ncbi:MAG: 50S ribosomal protein L10 [Thermoplasmatales archaeon]